MTSHVSPELSQSGAMPAQYPAAVAGMEAIDPASRLRRVLESGAFTVTAELAPPDSADPAEVLRRAALFDGVVDAINATDGSGANVHMSSIAVSSILHRAGITAVAQVSCRDRNRIAIQGDVLGAAALGIGNVLCLTGDGVGAGDHPGAKPVFDLGSVSLLAMLKRMRDERRYLSGRAIEQPPRLFLGAAANPFAPPIEHRARLLVAKIDAGAQFFQTQYCFDIPVLRRFMQSYVDLGLAEHTPILVGVGPLASAKAARWIRNHVPGVHIPDDIIRRLDQSSNPAEEGRAICIETLQSIAEIDGVSGAHVMAHRQERFVADIITCSGVLGHRKPARSSG